MTDSTPNKRLFFALWPNDDTRNRIARLVRAVRRKKGKPVAMQNLHITLAFVGSVDLKTCRCLQTQAASVRFASFPLRISHLGYFPRSRVLWAGPESCPAPLSLLVEDLNACLLPCGYQPESRPFHPHLTLLRKAIPTKPLPDLEPVNWQVENFCLVESRMHPLGVHYEVLQTYPQAV